MSREASPDDLSSVFGDVVFFYSRAQAISDGVLIDASELARDAGFRLPVAITSAAWADCVAWSREDSARQVHQDQTGRLWDVLWMAGCAARAASQNQSELLFELYRVPRDGHATDAESCQLKLLIGPGDEGEPVITILLPGED